MMENVFKQKGIEVYSSANAYDCIHIIKDLSPDILIVDFETMSPELEIFFHDLCPSFHGTIIMMIEDEDKYKYKYKYKDNITPFQKFVHGFLNKPISPSGLLERLKLIMDETRIGEKEI